MEQNTYLQVKKRNKNFLHILDLHQLPHHNGYAFADAFCRKNDVLHYKDDYLILLALLWSPNDHLFFQPIESRDVSGIDIAHASIEETASLRGFKSMEPEKFEKFCSAQSEYQEFLSNVSASSQIFALRFKVIRSLLLTQRELIAEYHTFLKNYEAKRKSIAAEIESLLADETANDLESEYLITLMDIALEYINNLRKNPKNRSKYAAAQQRLERYVTAARKAAFIEDELEALDDIIGSLFERLLKVAAFYAPIEPIGPMYLCWMLENRLLKFANPAKEPRNLLLIDNAREKLFATKIEWHAGRPSTSDEARIYLFDALCTFWEKWFYKSTQLSRFLFEKTLPYYSDFMKADMLPSESAMSHDFVQYDTAVFSNDLLQRILSVFNTMLQLELDAYPLELNVNSQILNDVSNIKTDEQYTDFLQKMYDWCFQESEDRIRTISNSKIKIQTNRKEFLKKAYQVFKKKPMLEDFKRIMFLNPTAYGSWHQEGTEWANQFHNWFADWYEEVKFDFQIKITGKTEIKRLTPEAEEYIREQLDRDQCNFYFHTSALLYSKAVRDDLVEKLALLSKKMYFYEDYSDEQYQKLLDFCI